MQRTSALVVMDDYGPIGRGASRAHQVAAENGEEYIVKGPSLTPEHPTVAANEWIAAQLASALGLPILPYQVLRMGNALLFGSLWMPPGATWYNGIDRHLFDRCDNRERVYDVLVLDTWLINRDRHNENLIVRRVARTGRHTLMLNDHSHLLVSPVGPRTVADLMGCLDDPPGRFVRLAFIRDIIDDPVRLDEALDRVEALSDTDVRAIVDTTPLEFLAGGDRRTYTEFLVQRRPRLRDLFTSDPAAFPRLRRTEP
jgi:hypothetical protein